MVAWEDLVKAGMQKGDREKKGGDVSELKEEVKALAKVVKALATEPKPLYSSVAAGRAPGVLVVLSRRVRETVVALGEETEA